MKEAGAEGIVSPHQKEQAKQPRIPKGVGPRLHKGQKRHAHTSMTILFKRYARGVGIRTTALPADEGGVPAAPLLQALYSSRVKDRISPVRLSSTTVAVAARISPSWAAALDLDRPRRASSSSRASSSTVYTPTV